MEDTQEIAVVLKKQISGALKAAEGLQIQTAEDLGNATSLLSKIKAVGKLITAEKEKITKPLNEGLKNARAFFAPFEDQYEEAEGVVKRKMVVYQTEQQRIAAEAERKREEEAAKLAAKVEAGRMKPETAVKKIEQIEVPEVQTKVEGKKGGAAQFRTVKEVVIVDESLVPREYLIPDMVKIRKVAQAGVEIPGIKVEAKQVVAGY